jgi:NADH-quinone oxidoreductase subunit L
MSMAIPLIVLAIGSIFAGYVGVPHALGGNNRIESFLHPSFQPPGAAHDAGTTGTAGLTAGTHAVPQAAGSEAHGQAAADHATGANEQTELMLMALSSGVAVAGIGIAAFFWLRRRDVADGFAQRFGPVYRTLCNKYYVDEIYDAAIVHPIEKLSTGGLWKGVDATVIDGLVNGVGLAVRGSSGVLRRAQTGSIRVYAASLFLGVVMILGWYLWR